MSDITNGIERKAVTWFNTNKQRNTLLLLVIIMGIILLISFKSCTNANNQIKINEQNIKALNDSVRYNKNKVGDLEASKNVLITEKKGLGDLNNDLATELKKEVGKVYELNKFILSLKNKPGDTVWMVNTLIKYPNGEYGLAWTHDTLYTGYNGRSIAGVSKFRIKDSVIVPTSTFISKDEVNFSIVTGLRQKGDDLEIFIRSDYPGFNVTGIEGAVIDPKNNPILKKYTVQKKWGVGPYVGVGVGINLKPSIQIGIGVHYSLFRF